MLIAAATATQVARRLRAAPRLLGQLALSALMIVSGWSVYVWAVNNGHNIESSLGYYINPLLNMAIGATFFRERIDAIGLAAIALAAVGTVAAGAGARPPAADRALPGGHLHRLRRDPQARGGGRAGGLFVESLLMWPPGLALVLWLPTPASATFGHWRSPVTLLLLAWDRSRSRRWRFFAWTTRRLPLSTVGFLQFTGPTLGFLIGLAVGERLTPLGAGLVRLHLGRRRAVHVRRLARGATSRLGRPDRPLAPSTPFGVPASPTGEEK